MGRKINKTCQIIPTQPRISIIYASEEVPLHPYEMFEHKSLKLEHFCQSSYFIKGQMNVDSCIIGFFIKLDLVAMFSEKKLESTSFVEILNYIRMPVLGCRSIFGNPFALELLKYTEVLLMLWFLPFLPDTES